MSNKTDEHEPFVLTNKPMRAELSDPAVIDALNLRPSPNVLDQIRKLEEAGVLAEQRLGSLRVA
jgi:hypothetical protein